MTPTTGSTSTFVLAGGHPGDGKPKPVVFPDPEQAAVRGRRVALLPLAKLIELKLASGLSAPRRLKDLASVRPKYEGLWQAAQVPDRE